MTSSFSNSFVVAIMLLAIFWTNGQVSEEKINDSYLVFKFLQKTFFLLDLLAGGRIL
jgi:hypothetical protein